MRRILRVLAAPLLAAVVLTGGATASAPAASGPPGVAGASLALAASYRVLPE